jgi:hypothetical protein
MALLLVGEEVLLVSSAVCRPSPVIHLSLDGGGIQHDGQGQ